MPKSFQEDSRNWKLFCKITRRYETALGVNDSISHIGKVYIAGLIVATVDRVGVWVLNAKTTTEKKED